MKSKRRQAGSRLIFISHNGNDAESSRMLTGLLKNSIARKSDRILCSSFPGHQIPISADIQESIEKDLGSSDAVFILASAKALKSRWVQFEMALAIRNGRRMIALLGPGISESDLPLELERSHHISILGKDAGGKLVSVLRDLSESWGRTLRWKPETQGDLERFIELLGNREGRRPAGDLPGTKPIDRMVNNGIAIFGNVRHQENRVFNGSGDGEPELT